MAKYSFNLKMKILQEYQQGKVGIKTLAKQHSINSYTSVRKWVAVYQKFGEEGLRRNRQQMKYTVQFKQNDVELYLSYEKSYRLRVRFETAVPLKAYLDPFLDLYNWEVVSYLMTLDFDIPYSSMILFMDCPSLIRRRTIFFLNVSS